MKDETLLIESDNNTEINVKDRQKMILHLLFSSDIELSDDAEESDDYSNDELLTDEEEEEEG